MLRTASAGIAFALVIVLSTLVPDASLPARAANGLIGAVGCSQTRDAFGGIRMIGADGYWNATDIGGYGGGTIAKWSDANSRYWTQFEDVLAENPGTSDVWVELCVKDRTDPTPTAADLAAGEAIVEHVQALAPTATIHVSAMNEYSGIVCTLSGPAGPAVSEAIADHVVLLGLALPGPAVGPLDTTTVGPDGCHANEAGRLLQAEQLEAYFAEVIPPPTTPPTTRPPRPDRPPR